MERLNSENRRWRPKAKSLSNFCSILILTSPLLVFLLIVLPPSASEPTPIREVKTNMNTISLQPDGPSCKRAYISPLSRMYNIKSYANSRKVSLNISASILEKFHWEIEVSSHRDASIGPCQCGSCNWKSLQNGQWTGFMSPYEQRYIDIRIKDQISSNLMSRLNWQWRYIEIRSDQLLTHFSLSIQEEFQQWRLVCLGIGFMLLIIAPLVSDWVPFYYSSSLALGILLLVLLIPFQSMKLLPLGRKNLLYLTLYGSVLGIGSYAVYYSSIVNSILVNFGLSEEMHNPVIQASDSLVVLVVLASTGLGCWFVRKFVLSTDGRVGSGIATFVLWTMRVIAIFFIVQSSLDRRLALVALGASGYCCFVGYQIFGSNPIQLIGIILFLLEKLGIITYIDSEDEI